MKSNRGKIITVTSTKGGVGKTITTLNLAGTYEKLGYKTLIIDFDLYGGSVATYLNSTNDKTIFNLVEDLNNNRYEKIEDYLFAYSENIDIIAAPKDPRMASKIDSKYIPLIFRNVIYKYDVILIDTTHNLNEINIVTIDNSDAILYIFTNDTFDLKNTKSFISIMKDAGFTNYYTLLNESVMPGKNYYSMFDIRSIIKNNIDFTISKSMHLKNIDKFLLEGQILINNKSVSFTDKKEWEKLKSLALTLIENSKPKENSQDKKEDEKWKKPYLMSLN